MTAYDAIAAAAFQLSLTWLEELKAAPLPLPVGVAARFQSLVPSRNLEELYEKDNPYWHGYAATMQEFKDLLASLPRVPFKAKTT